MFAQKAPPPRGWDLHRDNRRMPLQLENEALLELTVAIAGRPVAYELSQDTVTFRTKGAAVEARRACRECPLRGCTGHFEEGQTDAGGGRQPEGPGLPTPSVPPPCKTVPASVRPGEYSDPQITGSSEEGLHAARPVSLRLPQERLRKRRPPRLPAGRGHWVCGQRRWATCPGNVLPGCWQLWYQRSHLGAGARRPVLS